MTDHDDLLARLDAGQTVRIPFGSEPIHVTDEAAAAIRALVAERDAAVALLDLYRQAVVIGVTMEGPRFTGSNATALKRAWLADRALADKEPTP